MCIYCNTTNYRKIYEKHFGPIPKEEDGRTYDIHHIDGDRSNNIPENLVALTIQQHYELHEKQSDWYACWKLAVKMRKSPEEISELARREANKRVANGTHHWIGGEFQRRQNIKRVEDGIHQFMTRPDGSNLQTDRVKNGTHHLMTRPDGTSAASDKAKDGTNPWLKRQDGTSVASDKVRSGSHNLLTRADGTNLQTDRIANGTHHLLGENSPTQVKWHCQNCGKHGKGQSNFTRWHSVESASGCHTKINTVIVLA